MEGCTPINDVKLKVWLSRQKHFDGCNDVMRFTSTTIIRRLYFGECKYLIKMCNVNVRVTSIQINKKLEKQSPTHKCHCIWDIDDNIR